MREANESISKFTTLLPSRRWSWHNWLKFSFLHFSKFKQDPPSKSRLLLWPISLECLYRITLSQKLLVKSFGKQIASHDFVAFNEALQSLWTLADQAMSVNLNRKHFAQRKVKPVCTNNRSFVFFSCALMHVLVSPLDWVGHCSLFITFMNCCFWRHITVPLYIIGSRRYHYYLLHWTFNQGCAKVSQLYSNSVLLYENLTWLS